MATVAVAVAGPLVVLDAEEQFQRHLRREASQSEPNVSARLGRSAPRIGGDLVRSGPSHCPMEVALQRTHATNSRIDLCIYIYVNAESIVYIANAILHLILTV